MKIALHQGPSPAGDLEAAFAAVEAVLAAASAAGARMAVFPELFLPGYNSDAIKATAEPQGGPWHRRLAEAARRADCGITIGYAERSGEALHNAAIAISAEGATLGHFRKLQAYGPREAALLAPGGDYAVFDLEGRRTALLICYDVEFAPHVRAVAERGAELILVPTANMLPFTHVSRLTVPAQAVNHAVTIAYANYCGTEGALTYAGGSLVAGIGGEALVAAGPGEALLVANLAVPVEAARLSTQLADYRASVIPQPSVPSR